MTNDDFETLWPITLALMTEAEKDTLLTTAVRVLTRVLPSESFEAGLIQVAGQVGRRQRRRRQAARDR